MNKQHLITRVSDSQPNPAQQPTTPTAPLPSSPAGQPHSSPQKKPIRLKKKKKKFPQSPQPPPHRSAPAAGDGNGTGRSGCCIGGGESGPAGPPDSRRRGNRRRGALAGGLLLHRALLSLLPRAPQVLLQARLLPRRLGEWFSRIPSLFGPFGFEGSRAIWQVQY